MVVLISHLETVELNVAKFVITSSTVLDNSVEFTQWFCLWCVNYIYPTHSHYHYATYVHYMHRFLLQFSVISGGPSVLNVVETNPFRHLNHLSLKFVSASDAYLKKYLAECLIGLKVCVCVCVCIKFLYSRGFSQNKKKIQSECLMRFFIHLRLPFHPIRYTIHVHTCTPCTCTSEKWTLNHLYISV